jgi:sporulation protein YlmC with PRC-barrel domain
MRLSDLRDAKIRTVDGERLGRVHEVHTDTGRVTAIVCGTGGWIERLTAKKEGRRIPWGCVVKVDRKGVVVTSDPPQQKSKKASAPRSRQGTRRPSGQPSKR